MTSDSPHLRMGVLGIVVISLFAALFSRLWFLQVMSAPTLTVAAQTNRERVVSIPPVRGRILDREGRVLADNRLSTVVTVDRKAVADEQDKYTLFLHLAPVLGEQRRDERREVQCAAALVGLWRAELDAGAGCRPRAGNADPVIFSALSLCTHKRKGHADNQSRNS